MISSWPGVSSRKLHGARHPTERTSRRSARTGLPRGPPSLAVAPPIRQRSDSFAVAARKPLRHTDSAAILWPAGTRKDSRLIAASPSLQGAEERTRTSTPLTGTRPSTWRVRIGGTRRSSWVYAAIALLPVRCVHGAASLHCTRVGVARPATFPIPSQREGRQSRDDLTEARTAPTSARRTSPLGCEGAEGACHGQGSGKHPIQPAGPVPLRTPVTTQTGCAFRSGIGRGWPFTSAAASSHHGASRPGPTCAADRTGAIRAPLPLARHAKH